MPKRPRAVFGAVGDIGFHGEIGASMLAHGADWPFERMRDSLARADVLFGNMESVFIPPDYPKRLLDPAGLISRVPGPDAAAALRRAGFSFLNMAANHVLDAGTVGMFHTRDCLEAAGLVVGGVGRTQEAARKLRVVECNGLAFGFLCYSEDNNYSLGTTGPCHAWYVPRDVVTDVKKARRSVDVLVVSVHADIEFMETPSVPRMAACRRIAEAGADIILCHHPHVPQGIEVYDGTLIAYSLGNFVFDSHTMGYMKENGPHTAASFLLLVDVSQRGVEGFERVPVAIHRPPEERPHLATGAAGRKLARYFALLDAMLADDEIVRANWRRVAKEFLRSRIDAAAKERDVDRVIENVVARILFVAENRSVMDEVAVMAKEFWDEFRRGDDKYNRPHRRLSGK
jgi:hypothetical protein